jgi:membrane protease YdiL (CAAX protease family)
MLAISAAVVAPLVEEIVFRGFIYGVLKRFTDGIFAAICSSLLFAIVHMHVGTMFPLAILALFFCAAYEITGCLFVPMIMHGIFNATSLTLMILFPELPK